jgi:antibiotic biosynthesis monooxygenase (ABM) superfamily enzyme
MDSSVHVTAVITHRVRPGRETGYEEWIKGIAADSRSFEGYLGSHILRPELGVTPDHVIVLQFDTCHHLETWMQSESRKGWIERVQPLIREPESIKTLTGLEAWFQLPGQPSHSPPKLYKQAILVWIGVAASFAVISPLVAALLASWPGILMMLVKLTIMVGVLTYGVMPFLTRRFQGWLLKG